MDPEKTKRLRISLLENANLACFEGHQIGHADIAIKRSDDPVTQVIAGRLQPPARIFGTPFDVRCLDGIGDWPVHAPEKQAYRIEQGRIIGPAAIVSSAGDLYLPTEVRTEAALKQADFDNRSGYPGFALKMISGERARCSFITRLKPRTLPLHAAFFSNLESANYGSFIFRQLPQMLFLRERAADCDCYVVAERTAWHFEALRLLGLPAKPSFTVNEVCGEAFRSVTVANEFDAEAFIQGDIARLILSLGLAQSQSLHDTSPEKIYVSRALSGVARPGYRNMINEPEIENEFRSHGFEIVYPETLSLASQMVKFRLAKYIAGPSGSGMFNSIFAPVGCRVLDIESYTQTVRQHAKFYAATGKVYAFLFGEFDRDDPSVPITRRYTVSGRGLSDAISWLLG